MKSPKMWFCAFALVCILVTTGCQTAPPPEAKKDTSADMAKVATLRDQYTAAANSNDAAAVAALYTDDAVMMPSNEAAVEGKTAIQSWYENMYKRMSVKIAITPIETQVAGDWAYDRGTAMLSMTPKAKGKPMEESSKYLVILKRQTDGSWKCFRDIDNSNAPMMAPAANKKAAKKKK
jgi:uncharacterized protein (TIGR02246 family)